MCEIVNNVSISLIKIVTADSNELYINLLNFDSGLSRTVRKITLLEWMIYINLTKREETFGVEKYPLEGIFIM